jgi:hypothetical protein
VGWDEAGMHAVCAATTALGRHLRRQDITRRSFFTHSNLVKSCSRSLGSLLHSWQLAIRGQGWASGEGKQQQQWVWRCASDVQPEECDRLAAKLLLPAQENWLSWLHVRQPLPSGLWDLTCGLSDGLLWRELCLYGSAFSHILSAGCLAGYVVCACAVQCNSFACFVWAANALYSMTQIRAAAMAVVCLSQPPSQHNNVWAG